MDLGKLQKTFVREFKRSPAKTCVLIGLLPVAGYFVGPLVWKSVRPGKTPASPAAQPMQIAAATPAVGTAAGATAGPKPTGWKEAATWIEMDSLMRASPHLAARNPFQSTSRDQDINAKEAAKQQGEENSLGADVRPEELGLRLTATIVGTRIRMATISGKQYHENARITVGETDSTEAGPVTSRADAFVLKLVDRKYVILERNGKTYQLPLAR